VRHNLAIGLLHFLMVLKNREEKRNTLVVLKIK